MGKRVYPTQLPALALDGGAGSSPGVSVGTSVPLAEFRDQEATRLGAAELDRMAEANDRLSRATKDRERITPRDASKTLNEATLTRVPEFDEIRTPVSGRQMKARSRLKRGQQDRWTGAQYRAVKAVLTDRQEWRRITDQLAANLGDPEEMTLRDRTSVQRVDRAIRAYEEGNDRQHHLYANVTLPAGTTLSDYEQTVLHLDRWTVGAHNLHQISRHPTDALALEITTRRGMYMGQSEGGSDTGHVLPRGMSFTVERVYTARWRDADGNTGERQVVRLREVEEA